MSASVLGGVVGYKLKGESKLIKDLRGFENNLEDDILKISSKSNGCTTIDALGEAHLSDLDHLCEHLCESPAHSPDETITGLAVFFKDYIDK